MEQEWQDFHKEAADTYWIEEGNQNDMEAHGHVMHPSDSIVNNTSRVLQI